MRGTQIEIETRITPSAVKLRATGGRRVIGGYAAVFNAVSQDLGGFRERVDQRAFAKSSGDGFPGVVCRFDHTVLLGTVKAKTLRVLTDQTGLFYETDLPETRADILELVARGDVDSSSFAFQAYDDAWDYEDDTPMRSLLSVRLVDVAPVTSPAYLDATVGLRSLALHANAPIAEVIDLSNRHELRKLFVRTDGGPNPGQTPTAKPSLAERRLTLINTRYPGGHPPVGKDGRQALLEVQRRRWPAHEPTKSGREALLETLRQRWPSH